jgi:hypothetical protein
MFNIVYEVNLLEIPNFLINFLSRRNNWIIIIGRPISQSINNTGKKFPKFLFIGLNQGYGSRHNK